MTKSNKFETIIRPFNNDAANEIKLYFRTFAYKPTTHKTEKLRTDNGSLKRDENGRAIYAKTKPYFKLYAIGNLNKRVIQSIAARINRKHRRIAS